MKKTLQSILAASMMFQVCLAPTFANEEVVVEDEINAEETVTAPTVAENEEFNKGTWEKKDGKWVFKFEEGSYAENMTLEIGGKYYRFEGIYMCEGGWKEIGGNWFYFYSDGHEASGWDKIGNYWFYFDLAFENRMVQGFTGFEIEGTLYYFDVNGHWLAGTIFNNGNDWYLFDEKGQLIEEDGWHKVAGNWYYIDQGYISRDRFLIDGNVDEGWYDYYFNEDGIMVTNTWVYYSPSEYDPGFWYYFGSDGKCVNGWFKVKGVWYYGVPAWRGAIACDRYYTIDGTGYYFDKNGAMATGWVQDNDGYWYYANPNGSLATGWQKINNKWYYFDEEYYTMWTGPNLIDEKAYFLGEDGAMVTGWFKLEFGETFEWFEADASGAIQYSKWIGDYYVCSDYAMVTYCYVYNEDNGNYYWVDASGKYIPKWTTKVEPEEYCVYDQKTGEVINYGILM